MGDGRTFLSPVVTAGGIWRVRMTWPNGTVRYFGKFTSEKEAIEWISAHPRPTKFPTEGTLSEPAGEPPTDVAMNRGASQLEGSVNRVRGAHSQWLLRQI